MLSCGRVKTELFENADITASIYDVSEHAQGSSGITQGHFDCLFSFVKVRTEEFEWSSVFVWTGIFSKTLLVWTRIPLKTDKKDAFSKMIGICPLATHSYQNLQLQHKILTTATIDLGRRNFIVKSTRILLGTLSLRSLLKTVDFADKPSATYPKDADSENSRVKSRQTWRREIPKE